MKSILLAGVESDVIPVLKGDFKSSFIIRKRIVEVLRDKIENSRKGLLTDYESPSWAYRQADGVGYERALREVISLLEEKEM